MGRAPEAMPAFGATKESKAGMQKARLKESDHVHFGKKQVAW